MANGTGILDLGVPSNTPSGGITTVPEMPDAPRRTAGEMLESLAEDVRPYAGPHLTGGVLNVAKPIAALIDYIRKNPGRSAQFALENSMAGDTKLALESAMQAGRDVGSGQLGSAAYNTATAAGAAAAAALPVVGAKMLGLKTKLPEGKPFTLQEAKQTDFGGGGPELHGEGITLGAAMPDGVGTEGTEQIRFSIAETGPDGKVRFPGTATVNLVGNYGKGSLTSQVEGLVNIEVLPEFRNQGVGKRLVSALDASSPDGLKLYDIQEEARGYWEKLGAVDFKRNEDGLLTAVLPKSVK